MQGPLLCRPCANSYEVNETGKSPRATVARDVQIIVKTGGSEPLGRLTTQLATLLTEVPMQNLLLE